MLNLVLLIRKSSCQKQLMSKGSQSETRLRGIPCILPTTSMNRMATKWAMKWEWSIPRWMPLEKWSTITKIAVWPQYVGSPTMKSKERSSQGRDDTDNGQSKPACLRLSYLVCWQSIQASTNCQTSSLISVQIKFSRTRAKVFVIPICLLVGVAWNSLSNTEMKWSPLGNHIRPFFEDQSLYDSTIRISIRIDRNFLLKGNEFWLQRQFML